LQDFNDEIVFNLEAGPEIDEIYFDLFHCSEIFLFHFP